MDIDEALDYVGGYRRWHVTIFIFLGLSVFLPLCWQGLIIVFIGWEPRYLCKENEWLMKGDGWANYTPTEEEQCPRTENNSTVACQLDWVFENHGYYTIVEQWDLVCDRNYLGEMTQTSFHLGSLVAEIFFCSLIDRFGRKLIHVVSQIFICCLGVGTAFAPNYIAYSLLRAAMGMMVVASTNSGLTMILELFDSKRRTVAGIGLEFQWLACYLTLPLLAYYIHNWKIFQIVISVVSAVWIVYFWILPESPNWLVSIGKDAKAEEVLRKMARWNGVKIEPNRVILKSAQYHPLMIVAPRKRPNSCNSIESNNYLPDKATLSHHHKSYTDSMRKSIAMLGSGIIASKPITAHVPFSALFKDPVMLKHLILSSLLWFGNCIVYYGLILSSPSLGGNRFLNFIFMGLVELPAIILVLYTTDKYGRRVNTCVFHVIAGVGLAILVFIPNQIYGSPMYFVAISLVMISKFAISASFSVIILYTKELFPTNLRGTSSGVCAVLGRIGMILAPMAAYLSKTKLYWLPPVAFGIISTIVGLLTLLLPETTGKPMPQTIAEARALAHAPDKYTVYTFKR